MMKINQMSRDLRWMMFAAIIANISSRMLQPFMPLYLESLGASLQNVGLYFTLSVLTQVIFRILGGWISDNAGRLPTMAIGSIFGLLSTLAIVLAPTWEWAVITALLSGIGTSLVGPSYEAFIAEEAPQGAVGSAFGLMESLFLICQIIGPLLAGFLVQNAGYKVMLIGAFVIMFCATIVRLALARGKSFTYQQLKISTLSRDMRATVVFLLAGGLITWMFLTDGLLDASSEAVMPFLPKYATEVGGVSEVVYGGLFAFMSVIAMLTHWIGGNFADRYGNHISIAIGAGAGMLAFSLLAIFPTLMSFIIAFGLIGLSSAFTQPAFASLLSEIAPPQSLGVMYGVFRTAMGFMAIPAPTIGGKLYETWGPKATFALGIVLSLLAIPLSLLKLKSPQENQKEGDLHTLTE